MKKTASTSLFSIFLALSAIFTGSDGAVANASITIVAAENMYGEIAKEVGGPAVNVTSILNNPNQDPHLFTASTSTAMALNKADVIIYNGAGYDPWIVSLLNHHSQNNQHIIVVSRLMNIKNGSNPHVWFLPNTIPIYASNLVNLLSQLDPLHKNDFQQRLKKLNQTYQPLLAKIKTLKQRFNNTPVIATEPIFNAMTDSIGLSMHGKDFQINIMNDVPPTISQVKQFEDALRQHAVRVLIFNKQIVNPSTQQMAAIAKNESIPLVGISELMPHGLTYVEWIMQELLQLENALEKSSHDHPIQ